MNTYKSGDILTGIKKSNNPYATTTHQATLMVVDPKNFKYVTIHGSGDICVRVLKHETQMDETDRIYRVESRFFKQIEKAGNLTTLSLENEMNRNLQDCLLNFKVDSLNHPIELKTTEMFVGCQHITPKDAVLIANRILLAYGDKK